MDKFKKPNITSSIICCSKYYILSVLTLTLMLITYKNTGDEHVFLLMILIVPLFLNGVRITILSLLCWNNTIYIDGSKIRQKQFNKMVEINFDDENIIIKKGPPYYSSYYHRRYIIKLNKNKIEFDKEEILETIIKKSNNQKTISKCKKIL